MKKFLVLGSLVFGNKAGAMIHEMPYDCIRPIRDHLNDQEAYALAKTCKQLYEVLHDTANLKDLEYISTKILQGQKDKNDLGKITKLFLNKVKLPTLVSAFPNIRKIDLNMHAVLEIKGCVGCASTPKIEQDFINYMGGKVNDNFLGLISRVDEFKMECEDESSICFHLMIKGASLIILENINPKVRALKLCAVNPNKEEGPRYAKYFSKLSSLEEIELYRPVSQSLSSHSNLSIDDLETVYEMLERNPLKKSNMEKLFHISYKVDMATQRAATKIRDKDDLINAHQN